MFQHFQGNHCHYPVFLEVVNEQEQFLVKVGGGRAVSSVDLFSSCARLAHFQYNVH